MYIGVTLKMHKSMSISIDTISMFTELPGATTPHITWFLEENVLNASNSHKIDKGLESSGSRGVGHE